MNCKLPLPCKSVKVPHSQNSFTALRVAFTGWVWAPFCIHTFSSFAFLQWEIKLPICAFNSQDYFKLVWADLSNQSKHLIFSFFFLDVSETKCTKRGGFCSGRIFSVVYRVSGKDGESIQACYNREMLFKGVFQGKHGRNTKPDMLTTMMDTGYGSHYFTANCCSLFYEI